MDWILAALALFNIVSMFTIYHDRHTKKAIPPWTLFAHSLITSELAWLWLPIQVVSAAVLSYWGALSSTLGVTFLILLMISWVALIKSIQSAFLAEELTEQALQEGLGNNYLRSISTDSIETDTTISDWVRPFNMKKPGVERLRNIPYGPNGVKQLLDIYRPTNRPKEGCPVLLQIHGGGWSIGSKDHQALPLMNYLASKGWVCVSINYRLSPSVGFPTHLEDCKRALCWIKTEGQKFGMNPDFVAVTGGSAGGHLTALMGLTGNQQALQPDFPAVDTSVQAVVPFYGVYNFLKRFDSNLDHSLVNFVKNRVIFSRPEENPELWELASPIAHINEHAPPFMIVQGEIDSLTTVNGARTFKNKLKETSSRPVVYLELKGAEHAFDNIHSPRTDAVIKGVHRFLEWALEQWVLEQKTREKQAGKTP